MGFTLRMINEEDLGMIMNWRMSETVTRFMNTNPKLTMDGQKKWLTSLKTSNNAKIWLVEVDGKPAGVINLADIDWEKGTTSWGYYIGEEKLRSLRLAISLEMSLYDYCFDILGLNEVHNEVLKPNEGIWKLHVACGCEIMKEVAGEVEKDGIAYDVIHLSISRDKWLSMRQNKKYEKIDFDIFDDITGDMIPHHLGVAVADINNSIRAFAELGWIWDEKIIEDDSRNVRLAFLYRMNSNEMLELVSPINEKSPISHMLDSMKNVASPYHICYKVKDIEKTIAELKKHKYVLTEKSKPALAFDDQRVAFMLNRDTGLIELLEESKN